VGAFCQDYFSASSLETFAEPFCVKIIFVVFCLEHFDRNALKYEGVLTLGSDFTLGQVVHYVFFSKMHQFNATLASEIGRVNKP